MDTDENNLMGVLLEGNDPRVELGQLNAISEKIIGCAFKVANGLGCGFLEKVYENALAHELTKTGLLVARQHDIAVHYDGIEVGKYEADLLV